MTKAVLRRMFGYGCKGIRLRRVKEHDFPNNDRAWQIYNENGHVLLIWESDFVF